MAAPRKEVLADGVEVWCGDIACRRIEAALKQPDMFVSSPAPLPKQEALL